MAFDAVLKPCLATAICLCSAVCARTVLSQPAPPPDTVTERPREGLDPLGASLGSFRLFPELALQHMRDDNVFATDHDTTSDTVLVLRPRVTLRSDWTRNSLSAGISASRSQYSEYSGEDHNDSDAFVRGRWDTTNSGFFYADLNRSVDHEPRESADDAGGLERAQFSADDLMLGYRAAPGRLFYQVELATSTIDYDDVPGLNGMINNDDRDRDRLTGRVRLGYEVADGYSLFVQALDRTLDYDSRFDDNGFERSSDGSSVMVGASLNVTDLVFGDVYYGRKSHSYDDPRFTSIGGTTFGIDVAWNVTQLTTFSFEGRQEVTPTTILGAAGVDETRLGVRADHELLRNLILSLEWNTGTDKFKGIARQDDQELVRFGARYLMNRRLQIDFDYTSRSRDSDADQTLAYSKHILSIEFRGQL